MSYYTGPIFEIELSSYKLSVAGGGRYDEMIGKYSGGSTPACGFSIGFERIIDIMKNNETPIGAGDEEKIAYLITREAPLEKKREVLQKAAALRRRAFACSFPCAIRIFTRRRTNFACTATRNSWTFIPIRGYKQARLRARFFSSLG